MLINELDAVARGQTKRLMIFMPPGSAKSTYSSVLFPAWFLAQQPRLNVIGASHTATLAETFSRRVQNQVREHFGHLGYRLKTESAERWETSNGGEYRAVGVGGPIAGTRADLAIIDDPVKSRADAESETLREKVWNWYQADLLTRLKPGGSVALIMTRWHMDDLGGRLLEVESDKWRVIKLPALATSNDDPLGRSLGQPLWADDQYGYGAELLGKLDDYRAAGAMRDWQALYQQDPRPGEGALFRTDMIPTIDAEPAGGKVVRAWDLAATAQTGTRDPDWTVGVKLQRLPHGQYVVLDVIRFRGGPDEVEHVMLNTAQRDGRSVRVSVPQDPGQAGKQQVLYLTRRLAGFMVESTPETGDKATRAAPVASQVNVGNVSMVRGAWNRAFIDELAGFPSATKDDQVDALSRAFSMVGMSAGPLRITSSLLAKI